jgi:hypothetical protein
MCVCVCVCDSPHTAHTETKLELNNLLGIGFCLQLLRLLRPPLHGHNRRPEKLDAPGKLASCRLYCFAPGPRWSSCTVVAGTLLQETASCWGNPQQGHGAAAPLHPAGAFI